MRILARVERWLEQGIEGLFGRRGGAQPVEIGRRLSRLMEQQKQVSVSRVYAPNFYRVRVSAADYERLAGIAPRLSDELEAYLGRVAERQGYALVGPLKVAWEVDEELPPDSFEASASFSAAKDDDRRDGGQGRPGVESGWAANTLVFRRPDAPWGEPGAEAEKDSPAPADAETGPEVRAVRGPDAGRAFRLHPGENRVGRAEDNDLVLSDTNVSRHHAAFVREAGVVRVRDLGSRNGTRLNGERVEEAELADGDELEIGLDTLVYRER